jgi:SnoaL-like domain
MNAIAKDLTSVIDRETIRDCLARVARGEDRRDAVLLSSAYWPDAITAYSSARPRSTWPGSFQARRRSW